MFKNYEWQMPQGTDWIWVLGTIGVSFYRIRGLVDGLQVGSTNLADIIAPLETTATFWVVMAFMASVVVTSLPMLRHDRLRAPGIIGFVAGIYLISGAQGWFREEAIGFPVWIVGHIILIVGTLAVGLSVVFKPPPTQLTLREPAPSGIYRATLIDAGKKKGEVQQVLKQVSKDSGFRIAMIVERTPALLLENVSEEAARSLARRLEEFGATVEVAMNPEM